MWLRHPVERGIYDEIRDTDKKQIQAYLAAGWEEVSPVYMRRPDGSIVYVTHPVHQDRLRREEDCVVVESATPVDAPTADDATPAHREQRRAPR